MFVRASAIVSCVATVLAVTTLASSGRTEQPSEAVAKVGSTDQALEVTGVLVLRVGDREEAANAIVEQLPSVGGRLQGQQGSVITIAVARDRFSEAVQRMASVGVETGRRHEVRDRTPEIVDVMAELRSAHESRARVAKLLGGAGVKDPLRVEQALAQWDGRARDLERSLRQLRQATDFAVLRVELQPTFGVVTEDVPLFRLPFPWLDTTGLDRLMDVDGPREPSEGGIESSGLMDFHMATLRASDEELLGDRRTASSLGFRLRGVGDTSPIGFAAGMDIELGGGFSGGFLYEYRMVAGLGTAIGKHVSIGLVLGAGIGGLTGGHIPFGVDIPVESFVGIEAGSPLRLEAWARTSFVLASDDRQDGSETAPFGDEFSTGLGALLDLMGDSERSRLGFSVRGAYRELMGTHAYDISLGIGGSFLDYEYLY
jgi:hypothetical protein